MPCDTIISFKATLSIANEEKENMNENDRKRLRVNSHKTKMKMHKDPLEDPFSPEWQKEETLS